MCYHATPPPPPPASPAPHGLGCVPKSKITTHQRRHKNVTSILLLRDVNSNSNARHSQRQWLRQRQQSQQPKEQKPTATATSSFARRDAKGHAKGKAKGIDSKAMRSGANQSRAEHRQTDRQTVGRDRHKSIVASTAGQKLTLRQRQGKQKNLQAAAAAQCVTHE